MTDVEAQLSRLLRGVDRVVPKDELKHRLAAGKPLRVKLGMDPTAPSVTLGWAVVLRKLRHFQELGHTAVLIVGDFTAQVGDPSGKSETRRRLSADEVREYAESVLAGFRKVLLPEPLEVRYNSEWLTELDMAAVLELTSKVTVAQMLERSDFAARFTDLQPISLMEFMYPLLQGMDSVAIEADVELGGADQLWNLMMGRVLQERYGQPPQVALTMPLLIGTDGSNKMSQSLGNYIGIEEPPDEMFGKVMSIPDHLLEQYFTLATEASDVEAIAAGLADGTLHPGATKRRLGRDIVTLYHSEEAASAAEAAFDRVFKRGETPLEVEEFPLDEEGEVWLPALLAAAGLVASNSEGRRMIAQGAVRLDGERVEEEQLPASGLTGRVVQVGKRRYVRLVSPTEG